MLSRVGLSPAKLVPLTIAGVALVTLVSSLRGEGGLLHAWQLRSELSERSSRNFSLVQSIHTLRRELHSLRTDDDALERVVRRKLGLVRPDEVLYRLPEHEHLSRENG